jgi:hypothetical protein
MKVVKVGEPKRVGRTSTQRYDFFYPTLMISTNGVHELLEQVWLRLDNPETTMIMIKAQNIAGWMTLKDFNDVHKLMTPEEYYDKNGGVADRHKFTKFFRVSFFVREQKYPKRN